MSESRWSRHELGITPDMIAGVELYNETLVSPGYIEDRGYFWNQERGDDYLPSLRSGLQVQWTYSKLCNFSCVHCFNGSGPDWRGYEADPFRVADNLISAQPYNVCMCGGEPFTWAPIYDVVERLRKGGIPLVSTVSNGYIATPDRLQKLYDSGLTHLQISIDGYTNDEFAELRLKQDGLAKATAAVEAAVHIDWQDLSVSFTPTKRNIASWKDYCRFWADKGVTHIRTQPFMPIGRGTESIDLKPTDEQYMQFQLDTLEVSDELKGIFVDWGDPLEHIWFYTSTAAHPWAYGIQTDGWFELSSYVPVLLGSSLDHSIDEFWAKDAKKLWTAPIVRRFAKQLSNSVGMSQLDIEIYKEHSLHIDIFDDEQFEIFLTSDDLDLLRGISDRNIEAHLAKHG